MKKILIYQHQSSLNHGCEALVYTISEQIKSKCKDSKVLLASYYKKDDDKYSFPNVDEIIENKLWLRRFTFPWFIYQVDLRTLNNKKIQEMFMFCRPCYENAKSADVCVAVGGDTYCYNKGKEHWPLERKIKKIGKKMMLWGCSIEPDDIPGEMEQHLSNFDIITVRDPISYEALKKSKVKSQVYRCADPAFLLGTENCDLPEGWEEGTMVGLNFSPMVMGNVQAKDETRYAVQNLMDHVLNASDDKIILIPHVRLSFSDDITELRPLYEKYKGTGRVFLVDDLSLNARQLKYIISKCKMFVGARTHATIAAYSTGVPTLAIGYSVKARGIARDLFGTEEGKVVSIKELAGTNRLVEVYQTIYEEKDNIRKHLLEIMPEYQKKALISGEVLKGLIG